MKQNSAAEFFLANAPSCDQRPSQICFQLIFGWHGKFGGGG